MWPFKKHPKILVGKIHAEFHFTDEKKKASMYFMLYERKGERSFEILIETGRTDLENWYQRSTGYYNRNNYKNLDDFLAKHHAHYANNVKPWLDGCNLNPKYEFKYEDCKNFISAGIKKDLKAFFLFLKTHHGIDCFGNDDSIGSVVYKKITEAKEV